MAPATNMLATAGFGILCSSACITRRLYQIAHPQIETESDESVSRIRSKGRGVPLMRTFYQKTQSLFGDLLICLAVPIFFLGMRQYTLNSPMISSDTVLRLYCAISPFRHLRGHRLSSSFIARLHVLHPHPDSFSCDSFDHDCIRCCDSTRQP